MYDYEAYPQLAKFGLVDYDWSNAKLEWANESPMDCDGTLVKQAARNKAQNPSAKIFVYRNIVKALAWYTEVRTLLQDQSYWGFFIPYDGCRNNITVFNQASSAIMIESRYAEDVHYWLLKECVNKWSNYGTLCNYQQASE